MKKKILFGAITLLTLGVGLIYFFVLNPSHRNIAEEEATIILQARELQLPFAEGDEALSATYIDQVVQVTGAITDISDKTIELDKKVEANLLNSLSPQPQKGTSITLKGRCVGYDDLLEVVRIDQATVIKSN